MARYDVFAGPADGSYLLDVQTDLIGQLKTRVVVPLLPAASAPPPIARLNPIFEIGGRKVVMATPLLAAVPSAELGESRASLLVFAPPPKRMDPENLTTHAASPCRAGLALPRPDPPRLQRVLRLPRAGPRQPFGLLPR